MIITGDGIFIGAAIDTAVSIYSLYILYIYTIKHQRPIIAAAFFSCSFSFWPAVTQTGCVCVGFDRVYVRCVSK